jgi:Mg2+ and Co2+ transporter CorA
VNGKINAMSQLRKVNESINKELDYIERQMKGATEEKRRSWQGQKLKHVGEIRKQLSLLLDIAQSLYNAEEVAAFQQIVLEEIGRAAPEIRETILNRLTQARAIRCSVEFSPF